MTELQEDLDRYPVADSAALVSRVPVIDIGAIVNDIDNPDARPAIEQIASACREWGFFQVVGHGVSRNLIDATWQETATFFGAPETAKNVIMRTRENPWGYYNNELTKNQRDKKEVFDYTTDGIDPIYGAENRWPDVRAGRSSDTMCTVSRCRHRAEPQTARSVLPGPRPTGRFPGRGLRRRSYRLHPSQLLSRSRIRWRRRV